MDFPEPGSPKMTILSKFVSAVIISYEIFLSFGKLSSALFEKSNLNFNGTYILSIFNRTKVLFTRGENPLISKYVYRFLIY